jgi:methyltransferase (TIGR00027 family)
VREGSPSRTAEYVALFRALETRRGFGKRVVHDSLARRFLSPRLRAVDLMATVPGVRGLVSAYIDRRWPGPRPSAVVRTRVIDDALTAAMNDGAEQVVILGAGYDTRPYRLTRRGVRFFEVDHPDTHAVKRRRLGELRSGAATFVALDFASQEPGPALAEAGLDAGLRTVFLWEGVLSYLEPGAIDAMLRWMAATGAPGSSVIFTYADQRALDGSGRMGDVGPWLAAVERAGEPFRTGLDPRTLESFLAERRLRLVWDESTTDAAARLGRSGRRMPPFYRVALAERI